MSSLRLVRYVVFLCFVSLSRQLISHDRFEENEHSPCLWVIIKRRFPIPTTTTSSNGNVAPTTTVPPAASTTVAESSDTAAAAPAAEETTAATETETAAAADEAPAGENEAGDGGSE